MWTLDVKTDVRFPTSLTGDGTDAMSVPYNSYMECCVQEASDIYRNTECDYSSAYVTLYTVDGLVGNGMTFTIGRGNDIVGEIIAVLPFKSYQSIRMSRFVWLFKKSPIASSERRSNSCSQTWEKHGISCSLILSFVG